MPSVLLKFLIVVMLVGIFLVAIILSSIHQGYREGMSHHDEEEQLKGEEHGVSLIEKDIEVNDVEILLSGLKLVGDYLDKTILKPNNLNYPISRLLFLNSFK